MGAPCGIENKGDIQMKVELDQRLLQILKEHYAETKATHSSLVEVQALLKTLLAETKRLRIISEGNRSR
jgi:hypothetical protein